MNTITENSDILNKSVIEALYPYQVDELCRKTREYLDLNKESEEYHFSECPKCHCKDASFSPGGYTYRKDGTRFKSLLRCSSCHKRFVTDHGQLSFYSHLDKGIWNRIMEDTLNGVSLTDTAAAVDIHPTSVFRNRHKLLNFIEQNESENDVSGVVEIDETYVKEGHKGLVEASIQGKCVKIIVHNEADKRGISSDKVCIITALKRGSHAYVKSYNTGRPSNKDVEPLASHIKDKSYVFSDGIRVYEKILKEKKCTYKELVGIKEYDEVNHLNNVNSFHGRIKEDMRRYRGVSSIYINRYNALSSLKQKYLGYDTKEIILKLLVSFRKNIHYFYQRQMKEKIFTDPHVIEAREGLYPAFGIARLLKEGYSVCYTKPQT